MNANNIKEAWEEVIGMCMNSVWQKLWLDICNDLQDFEEVQAKIINDIIQLANQAGLEEADNNNVEEALLSYGESWSNEELQELEQHYVNEKGTTLVQTTLKLNFSAT